MEHQARAYLLVYTLCLGDAVINNFLLPSDGPNMSIGLFVHASDCKFAVILAFAASFVDEKEMHFRDCVAFELVS